MAKIKKKGMETVKFNLPKNLKPEDAYRRAAKRVAGDFRGFKYDPKTGKTSVT